MWKELKVFLQTMFTLARDLEQARNEIKEMRQDLTKLTLALQHLDHKINLIQQEYNSEHEKQALQLKIELLEFERQLPSTTNKRQKKNIRPPGSAD